MLTRLLLSILLFEDTNLNFLYQIFLVLKKFQVLYISKNFKLI